MSRDTPRTPSLHTLDLAEEALDRGDPESALALADEVLAQTPEEPAGWLLRGDALRELGEPEDAIAAYRRYTHLVPDNGVGWSALGTLLFDTLAFDEARVALNRAVRLDPTHPDGYWGRALLRERRGDHAGAHRDFLRANLLDPHYPLPVPLDDDTVEQVVEEALRAMNPAIRSYLQNVPIVLEELPDEDLCREWDPPMPPSEVLGYFSGPTMGETVGADAWSAVPATVVLFRKNLERSASDREGLLEQLRITVCHEIGHVRGLDEDDQARRGLE
jgi:predicted Zn-dependent protease with MMP-like domain